MGAALPLKPTAKDAVEDDEADVVVTEPPSLLARKFSKLSAGLCEVLNDYGLVAFLPMNISDGEVRHMWLLLHCC